MPLDLEALKTFIPYNLKPLEFGDVKPFESFGQHGKISSIPRKSPVPRSVCVSRLLTLTVAMLLGGVYPWRPLHPISEERQEKIPALLWACTPHLETAGTFGRFLESFLMADSLNRCCASGSTYHSIHRHHFGVVRS